MRLNNNDIQRCITACKVYQDQTGSEWMWEQYESLINNSLFIKINILPTIKNELFN